MSKDSENLGVVFGIQGKNKKKIIVRWLAVWPAILRFCRVVRSGTGDTTRNNTTAASGIKMKHFEVLVPVLIFYSNIFLKSYMLKNVKIISLELCVFVCYFFNLRINRNP